MTLLMREQEIARDNFERGMAEGIEKIIEIYREELNFEDEIIVQKLMKKYDLTKEEAEKYLK